MSDRRTRAVALAGDPAEWRATVREFLRYLRDASPSREEAIEWLSAETPATDRAAAEEQLSFLDAIGVVESGQTCTPGPSGREFLDTHDEGVLYEALTEGVGGFETLLESLAVRPLTDVEFMDLLEREFDAEFDSPDPIVAHRQWLQALGYATHDGGINELTRAGRFRVESDDALEPPRSKTPQADVDAASADADADSPAASASSPSEETPTAADAARADESPDVDAGPTADALDIESDAFEELKRRYEYACMVCGDRRRRSPEAGFARVYHPMPTDDDHGGPATVENAVVVCPNHYADFVHGLLAVDPQTLAIEHAYEEAVSGRTLSTVDGHDLGVQYLAYHNEVLTDF